MPSLISSDVSADDYFLSPAGAGDEEAGFGASFGPESLGVAAGAGPVSSVSTPTVTLALAVRCSPSRSVATSIVTEVVAFPLAALPCTRAVSFEAASCSWATRAVRLSSSVFWVVAMVCSPFCESPLGRTVYY